MCAAPVASSATKEPVDEGGGHSDGAISVASMAAAIGGLGALAVAQPVLDLIGREPGFLVAHALVAPEITFLPVLLVGGPLLAGAAVALVGRVAPRAGRLAAGVAIAVLAASLGLLFGRRLPVPPWLVASAALVAGVALARAFLRSRSLQAASRYLLVVPPVVVAAFLLALPPSLRAGAAEGWPTAVLRVEDEVPVVVLVLDEFGVTALMDGQGGLLVDRFPGFARLAADGVWYRNAVTVETSTQRAVPALLTGKRVSDDLVPNVADHPQSLFTLLSVTHEVAALEPVTDLCPVSVCLQEPPTAAETAGRWRGLLSDLAVVYGHVALPPDWTKGLPPIDQGWSGFGRGPATPAGESFDLMERVGQTVEGDRRADIERFLASLAPTAGADRPPLRVGHLVLPHRPWEYLPDGRPHGDSGHDGYNGLGWGPDPYFTAAGWRRHLLQVGLVDDAVSRTIDRLQELGIYDSTLLIVVADHGVVFESGVGDMRVTRPETVGWILPVPLFVKYPHGSGAGTVTDVRAETTDIVPTILDVLGADGPGDLVGSSLLGPVPGTRAESKVLVRDEWLMIEGGLGPQLEIAAEKEAWFPGGDPWALVPRPELRPLLGQGVGQVATTDEPGVRLSIAAPGSGAAVVAGTLTMATAPGGDEAVALAAEGEIVAITKVYDIAGGTARFSFLVDPATLSRGAGLEAWLVADPATLVR